MIISLRNLSYSDLKKELTKENRIVLYSCNACVKACGFGGMAMMDRLEKALTDDGFTVIGKDLISMGCSTNLVEKRNQDCAKKNLYAEADVIIPLICEDGYEGIHDLFRDKKVISMAKTLGVGTFTPDRGVVLTTPFENTGFEPRPEGYTLPEVAGIMNFPAGFFDDEKESESQTELVSLTIDGMPVTAEKDKNLMALCKEKGINIPHLCHHDDLQDYGACRLCLVKIEGFRDLAAACCVQVQEGMNITTSDETLESYRKALLELAISSGDHSCLTCTKGIPTPFAACELQAMVRQYGITESPYEQNREFHPQDNSSAVIFHDPNKCILCGRCVRACEEIAGLCNLGFVKRGDRTTIVAGLNTAMDQSACVSCMACTDVCPTGALCEKVVRFSGENWEPARVLGV